MGRRQESRRQAVERSTARVERDIDTKAGIAYVLTNSLAVDARTEVDRASRRDCSLGRHVHKEKALTR